MFALSVIITAYQAEKTIATAINSVLNTVRKNEIEIVVVDDCSKDNTCDIVRQMQKTNSNINLYLMEMNSGSPSAPRNYGIKMAQGEYITFLDDDDEFVADNLMEMLDEVKAKESDFAKGYLITKDGETVSICNKIFECGQNKKEIIKNIVSYQSTTNDFIVKKNLLLKNKIEYRTGLKIGEDTVFILNILIKAQNPIYIDNYFLIYNKRANDITNLSSTQNVSDKEVNHQLTAWECAEELMNKIGFSYYDLRLHAGFRNLLLSVVRYSYGISEETYKRLHKFAVKTNFNIKHSVNLSKRYQELYDAILSGDYNRYCNVSKRRLLINGYDLKFIMPLVKYFEENYNVKVDEWTGHNQHDAGKSKNMAEWADIIWCEWLLGNSVFYSKIKNKNQRLVIRAHRFELFRDFGSNVNWNNVDMIFTVSYYYFEQFISKFNIPRNKMRLLSNYVEDSIYSTQKTPDSVYNVGIVGILPKRKGFLRGLEILKILKERNNKFKLYVMGKSYTEIPWIKNNPNEWEYYMKCQKYIEENNLKDNVVFGGYVERQNLYNNIGYVLSLSDSEEPESFHLAPAEASCSGSMALILRWTGVEYIYPESIIRENIDEIADDILRASEDREYYKRESESFRQYVLKNYSLNNFMEELKNYMVHLRIVG